MKILQFSIALSLTLTVSLCQAQKYDPNLSGSYETCCGAEPVEFNLSEIGAYLFIPNAFTPNNDGFNDAFSPVFNEQIQYINYLVIYHTEQKDTISGVLYQVENIDPANLKELAWNGKTKDGSMHKGGFNYTVSVSLKSGKTFIANGKACSILCDPESDILKANADCFYPLQADGTGRLSKTKGSQETKCFDQ